MKEQQKRMGRPPEGRGHGGEPERIRDYPKLLVTIRPIVRSRLKAIASIEKRAAWQIIEDSLALYYEQLPAEQRRAVSTELRRGHLVDR